MAQTNRYDAGGGGVEGQEALELQPTTYYVLDTKASKTKRSKMANWKALTMIAFVIGLVGLSAVITIYVVGQGYVREDVSISLPSFLTLSLPLSLTNHDIAKLLAVRVLTSFLAISIREPLACSFLCLARFRSTRVSVS